MNYPFPPPCTINVWINTQKPLEANNYSSSNHDNHEKWTVEWILNLLLRWFQYFIFFWQTPPASHQQPKPSYYQLKFISERLAKFFLSLLSENESEDLNFSNFFLAPSLASNCCSLSLFSLCIVFMVLVRMIVIIIFLPPPPFFIVHCAHPEPQSPMLDWNRDNFVWKVLGDLSLKWMTHHGDVLIGLTTHPSNPFRFIYQ